MAKSKLLKGNQKIMNTVISMYTVIEKGVVTGYKKIENSVVNRYNKIANAFVDEFLTRDGETVEDAHKRLSEEARRRSSEEIHSRLSEEAKKRGEII